MQRGHRPSTTPMDFEWANHTGPVEASSPFVNPPHPQSAKKRTHSVLDDSPSKSGFATPTRPREPDSRAYYFSQDRTKPLPLPPHVQHAWEPRTPASTYDCSSGGETPNTPAVDSDAATPDTTLADRMGRLASDAASPRKPARRESWFKRAFGGSPSPLKERERDEAPRHHSHKAEHRIQKRRTERSRSSKRPLRDMGGAGDDDESDKEPPSGSVSVSPPPGALKQTYAMSLASFMHWLEAHPQLPSVLSYYMQLGVNIFLAGTFVYIVWGAWAAVLADVDIESQKHMSVVMVDIAACAKQYTANRCRPDEVVPAMEKLCGTWEACMNRDPKKVARASVTAKTFAMIFNSFVEEFSYKSMIFTAIIIFGGFNLSNWAFGLLRNQQSSRHTNPTDFSPQTPHTQRTHSTHYLEHNMQAYDYNQSSNQPYPWHSQQQQQQHQHQATTPYRGPGPGPTPQRFIEAPAPPPPLVHAQSMPAIPTAQHVNKTPRKRGIFS
ncbi:Di-sulfide bridge nucleocytoplasmic transport domain-containing protein [Ampelomyces quisqualis]|uniref:Di-sulfide bridge nucleocytoplasmic transport domain-containing protein n=1 Tax=Ampelomyces quisqualis TaxID=50730 RepID=A0A6A5R2S0_AMPQU|nr:Di-sulfide bridge nucleocytoplasmic transport domain-containing protein [Ampelomyces quisqualis]